LAGLAPETIFGNYRIIEPLGKGGMASVYKAFETGLDRYVALKVLPREFLHDETFSERFRREARVIARLEHPNIVPIHAFGIDDGVPWMAMRLVPGGTVHSLTREGPLAGPRILEILRGVADALDYAHENGVVHRDVKPQNILLDSARRVYLADFGVARMLEGPAVLTQEGAVTGTPQYMAPEQAMAQPVDRSCDIYALGIVAYEMFTGRVPFQADTPVAVLMKHVMDPVPLRPLDGVPEPAAHAIVRCLAKKREDRWPTARAFVEALEGASAPAQATPLATAVSPAVTPMATPAANPPITGSVPEKPQPPPPVPMPPRARRRSGALLPILVCVAAVSGLVWWGREQGWQLQSTWPLVTSDRPAGPAAAAPAATVPRAIQGALPVSATVPVSVPAPSPVAAETPPPAEAPPPSVPAEPPPAPPPGGKQGDTWSNPRDGLPYVFIPAASRLRMGCVPNDPDCYPDEKPRHDVSLSRGFWLSRTEVPVEAYTRFAESTRRSLPPAPGFNPGWTRGDHPIVNVTWAEAQAYCEWAGGRLPTEAEWEHAARGGKPAFKFPWGNKDPECRPGPKVLSGARFDDRGDCREGATQAVASYGPNPFGLHDAAGNAFEWCSDWYGERYYGASPKVDPTGPPSGTERVLRGGSLNSRARGLRTSLRNHLSPGARSVFVGVRCAAP
jgi:eukaryotic-like serine/threonine-protein kinase